MNKEPWCHIRIANVNLRVPVVVNEETTQDIAKEVEECIARIESESSVIDTQKFALLAAFSFAVEKQVLQAEHDQDNRDLVKALETLATQLKSLSHRFSIAAPPRNEK